MDNNYLAAHRVKQKEYQKEQNNLFEELKNKEEDNISIGSQKSIIEEKSKNKNNNKNNYQLNLNLNLQSIINRESSQEENNSNRKQQFNRDSLKNDEKSEPSSESVEEQDIEEGIDKNLKNMINQNQINLQMMQNDQNEIDKSTHQMIQDKKEGIQPFGSDDQIKNIQDQLYNNNIFQNIPRSILNNKKLPPQKKMSRDMTKKHASVFNDITLITFQNQKIKNIKEEQSPNKASNKIREIIYKNQQSEQKDKRYSVTRIKKMTEILLKPKNEEENKMPPKVFNIFNILRFKPQLKKWRRQTQQFKIQTLKNDKYQIINDRSVAFEDDSKHSFIAFYYQIHECVQILLKKLEEYPTFREFSTQKFIFDFLVMISIVLYFIYIPLYFTFHMKMSNLFGPLITYPTFFFQYIEIFVQMNTQYYDKGTLIVNRKKIIINYFQTKQYIIDLFSIIGITYIFITQAIYDSSDVNPALDFILLGYFIKIKFFSELTRKIQEKFQLIRIIRHLISLLKLLLTVIFISHLLACLWIIVAKYEKILDSSSITWLDQTQQNNGFSFEDSTSIYVYAYYFSTVTMVTVGYGDILPKTLHEHIISIGAILFSCGVFAYCVNSIGIILQEMYKDEDIVNNNLYTINKYMNQKSIPEELQNQIRQYLYYIWSEQNIDDYEKQQKIIGSLPENLRIELLKQANKFFLKNSRVFTDNFSKPLLDKCIGLVSEVKIPPGQYLEQDMPEENCIYYIFEGSVKLEYVNYSSDPPKEITHLNLNKGKTFGEREFFNCKAWDYRVKCKEYCTLVKIKRIDFLKKLHEYPEDYEKFCMIKDKLLMPDKISEISSVCHLCKGYEHTVSNCPCMQFKPDMKDIINKSNQSEEITERTEQEQERDLTAFNALDEKFEIADSCEKFQADYQDYFEEQDWYRQIEKDQHRYQMLEEQNQGGNISDKEKSNNKVWISEDETSIRFPSAQLIPSPNERTQKKNSKKKIKNQKHQLSPNNLKLISDNTNNDFQKEADSMSKISEGSNESYLSDEESHIFNDNDNNLQKNKKQRKKSIMEKRLSILSTKKSQIESMIKQNVQMSVSQDQLQLSNINIMEQQHQSGVSKFLLESQAQKPELESIFKSYHQILDKMQKVAQKFNQEQEVQPKRKNLKHLSELMINGEKKKKIEDIHAAMETVKEWKIYFPYNNFSLTKNNPFVEEQKERKYTQSEKNFNQ